MFDFKYIDFSNKYSKYYLVAPNTLLKIIFNTTFEYTWNVIQYVYSNTYTELPHKLSPVVQSVTKLDN